jgi:hypothetical protein
MASAAVIPSAAAAAEPAGWIMDERDGFISWLRGEFAAANTTCKLRIAAIPFLEEMLKAYTIPLYHLAPNVVIKICAFATWAMSV